MRKPIWLLLTLTMAAWTAAGSAASAAEREPVVPEKGTVLIGISGDLLLGQRTRSRGGFSLNAPFLSYFAGDRLRLDLSPRLAYGSSDNYSLGLVPGFRYYYPTSWRTVWVSSGAAAGFDVVERNPPRSAFANDVMDLYVVPIEFEYWENEAAGFSFGLQYGGTLYDGADDDLELSIIGGFRWRLR